MRINMTTLVPTGICKKSDGPFRIRLISRYHSEEDAIENLPSFDNVDLGCFIHKIENSDMVTEKLIDLAETPFLKGIHYWRLASIDPGENDAWVTDFMSHNTTNMGRDDLSVSESSYMVFGAYDHSPKLYFLGLLTRGAQDISPTAPFKAWHYEFILNPAQQFLAYDRLSGRFCFESLQLIIAQEFLTGAVGRPNMSLTDIEERHETNISLTTYYEYKATNNEPASTLVEHELLNSIYIKPAIAEIMQNTPNLSRIRVFQEVADLSPEQIKSSLNGYTIPDEIVGLRNEVPNFPRIDNQGKYIDEPEDFMPDTYAYEDLPKDPFKINNETEN